MIALARWFSVLIGGLIIGAGLTIHGQVALAHYLREEAANTFFLWRAIGHATFWFQGEQTQMALAMSKVPAEALVASDRAAWVLIAIGFLVACCGPLIRKRRKAKNAR